MTENQDPPPRKRLRRSSEERVTRLSEREGTLRDKNQLKSGDELTTYSAELLLYDRQRRCQLSAGRYDVAVEEPKTSGSSTPLGKHSTWETVTDGKVPCHNIFALNAVCMLQHRVVIQLNHTQLNQVLSYFEVIWQSW